MKIKVNQKYSYLELSNCIRILGADGVEKARSGHPGMVLGMADVMTSLVFNFLKFHPMDPTWFGRDRLVLSAGHGSMLLYSVYYLTGYKDFALEDIKNFRQLYSKTAGHPEYGAFSAIEATTGPLGQGFANSVGMAIAQKKYQHELGEAIGKYKIYCIVGDGCLMEGISYEAASLAGHLGLNNLIVLFDDNKISIDGPTNLAVSEDHIAKFKALGWNTDEVDGHNFTEINAALEKAQTSCRPYFIACRTMIAKGCPTKAGSQQAHGAPLGKIEISILKQNLQMPEEEFCIPEGLMKAWRQAGENSAAKYNNWQAAFSRLTFEQKEFLQKPIIDTSFISRMSMVKTEEATRVSSGRIIEELAKLYPRMIFGSADLSFSNNIKNLQNTVITANNFGGNFIHYGVRENAMAAIMNGLALSGFLPVGGTFLVFSDYMKPGIRLSAIMKQHVIYIMTHDSIGVGEDGPTHQPVEHLASMRAMPNLLLLRPADAIETAECWKLALEHQDGPVMLALTRQNVRQIREKKTEEENCCLKGAYILCPKTNQAISKLNDQVVDIKIFASGSEVSLAVGVQEILQKSGLSVEVISVPSFELFFQQDKEYIKSLLEGAKFRAAIEAGSSFGWHRIIGEEGIFFGVERFGVSAPAPGVYEYFGLTAENIAMKIQAMIRERKI